MKRQPTVRKQLRIGLVCEYEAMSQKGAVLNFEKTAFAEIALHYHEINHPAKALKVLVEALDVFELSQELRFLKAATHLALDERDNAMQELLEAEKTVEEDSFSNLFRAMALVNYQKDNEAFDWLMELSNRWLDHDVPSLIGEHGRLLSLLSTYGAMFEHFKDVVIRDPKNDSALEQIWVCVELSGRHEESAALHEYLTSKEPYSPRAWYNLGYAYMNLELFDDALDALEYAFVIDPTFEQAYSEHGGLAIRLGKVPAALSTYHQMLRQFESSAEAMVRIGECHHLSNDLEKALLWYKKAMGCDATYTGALYALAKCYKDLNNYSLACFWIEQAIDQESRKEEYYNLLGQLATLSGDTEKALYAYRKAVEIAPEDGDCWSALVAHYFHNDSIDEALEVLDDGMEHCLEPILPFCRAACNFRKGDWAAGMQWLKEAILEAGTTHPIFFEWMPELQSNEAIQEVLDVQ